VSEKREKSPRQRKGDDAAGEARDASGAPTTGAYLSIAHGVQDTFQSKVLTALVLVAPSGAPALPTPNLRFPGAWAAGPHPPSRQPKEAHNMRTKLTIAAATAATAAMATGGIAAAGATQHPAAPAKAAAVRHAEGRVTAINRSARTFTVRDAERGRLTVKVTRATKFERVTFASLRTGTVVDVRAKRVNGAWNATKVERGEVGEDHVGGDDRGGDDHGGGGNDDGSGHH
jgi:hypothetical protein